MEVGRSRHKKELLAAQQMMKAEIPFEFRSGNTVLEAGTYRVSTDYVPGTNRATNAPFSIFDGVEAAWEEIDRSFDRAGGTG